MAKSHSDALQHVFPFSDLVRGQSGRAVVWGVLGAVLLSMQLLNLFLITSLLNTRGALRVSGGEVEKLVALLPTSLEGYDPDNLPAEIRLSDAGLIPAVWSMRGTIWAEPLGRLVDQFPQLRYNDGAFLALLVVIVAIGFLRSGLLARTRVLADRVAMGVAGRMRQSIHRQTLRLGPSDLQDRSRDFVLDLFTSQVDRVHRGLSGWIVRVVNAPLTCALLVLLAISIHWRVTLQCIVPLGLCWYLIHRENRRMRETAARQQSQADQELRLLAESLNKTRLVRGYGMEPFEQEQFAKHANRFQRNIESILRTASWSRRMERLLVVLCVAAVLYLIGVKVLVVADAAPESLSFPAAITLVATFAAAIRPLDRTSEIRRIRADAAEAVDRVQRYLNQIPEVGQAVGAKFLQPLSRALHFEAVRYSLPGRRKVLDGLDLKLNAGEVIALVSLDDLAPRAACYMLPRFIEPQSGRILCDGEDIAWVTLESLRAEAIFVGGTDPFLTGTVLENITCGSSGYSMQEATDAAKTCHAHNFIQRLPQGYETLLGEHGESLDAGESFRLGLARAVLRDPALLIIEEPLVSLDENTKSLLDDGYNRILAGRTVIFLPARLSTLRRADKVVLIHQGRVESVGTHNNLVKASQLYRHWEYVHFNQFRRSPGESE